MYSIPFNSIFRIPALVLAVLQLWGERRKAITTLATLCPCPAPHRRAIGRGDTWIVAFGVWHEGLVKTSYLCGSMDPSSGSTDDEFFLGPLIGTPFWAKAICIFSIFKACSSSKSWGRHMTPRSTGIFDMISTNSTNWMSGSF